MCLAVPRTPVGTLLLPPHVLLLPLPLLLLQGTGKWTIQQAAELSVAAPTIEASLDSRFLSGADRAALPTCNASCPSARHSRCRRHTRLGRPLCWLHTQTAWPRPHQLSTLGSPGPPRPAQA